MYEFFERKDGYFSIFLDKIKIEVLELLKDCVVILENMGGVELRIGDYNFEGFVLEWGVFYELK